METTKFLANEAIENKIKFADSYLSPRFYIRNDFASMKQTQPFSQRFNDWVEYWFEENKDRFIMVDHDEFDDTDSKTAFINMKNRFEETGKLYVVKTDFPTVFGNSVTYDKFRAWHDYNHVMCNCGFDTASESIVASVQASKLPEEWVFEKELITALITGTNQYYKIHKDYVKDQRQFVADYLTNPEKAIFTLQI